MTERFSNCVYVSIAGHIAIVLLVMFKTVLAPNEPLSIRNAIRVDIVGLPQKIQELPKEQPAKEPPKAPAPKVAEQPKPKAPQAPAPKAKSPDTKKAEERALDKLKEMEALEKLKEMGKEKPAKPAPVAGNKVSAGNSLTGLEKIEYDQYFDQLSAKVHNAWSIPQWLAEADLKAQVLVLIDERGYVIKKEIRKSSGNEVFDSRVTAAIDASSPLPPPPARLRGVLSTSGIIFNFPQ